MGKIAVWKKNFLKNVGLFLFLGILINSLSVFGLEKDDVEEFTLFITPLAIETMFGNIEPVGTGKGIVLAAPSSYPNYRYHWVRDAALIMNYVVSLAERETNPEKKAHYFEVLHNYAVTSRWHQTQGNKAGGPADGGGGDVRLNANGTIDLGGWMRPQNDGAALRASTVIRYAKLLLASAGPHYPQMLQYVKTILYDGKDVKNGQSTESLIQADLEYTKAHWFQKSYDIWEEVIGDHFYTLMAQRKALMDGARFAQMLGDPSGRSSDYMEQAGKIGEKLKSFWDGRRGYIQATINQDGGSKDKGDEHLDIQVILAALHAPQEDGLFSVTDDMILATAAKIHETFKHAYTINEITRDERGREMFPAVGRYLHDKYNGTETYDRGNPWSLSTTAMAELAYRARNKWIREGSLRVTHLNLPYLKIAVPTLQASDGDVIHESDARWQILMEGLRGAGDKYMRRVKKHTGQEPTFDEQWYREDGYGRSARPLTWTCEGILSALEYRGSGHY